MTALRLCAPTALLASCAASSHSKQRLQPGPACRQLQAAHSGGPRSAARRPLAVVCKKRQQQRAQQEAAKQRVQQSSATAGAGVGTSSSSSSSSSSNGDGNGTSDSQQAQMPTMGYSLSPGSQQVELGNIERMEVRGNELVLTMRGRPDSASAAAASAAIGEGSFDDEAAEVAVLATKQEEVMDAVVKIYCTHTEPNYSLPWQRKRQYASTSSGFVVSGEGVDGKQQRYLLTNAHSVEYYSQVKVKRRGDDRKWLAKVLAIGTECDVALLTVEEEDFWKDVQPLRFGPLPNLQESVYVVGYPIGGDTISVTSGVVSRIEVTAYAHGATELLGVQIDAAINSGNSGGPVFNEAGEVVGIAFQSYAGSDAENIGYVIPTPVINHFINDYQRNGTFTGFPALGVQWQRMESAALRKHFKMSDEQKGVLVRSVQPISFAHGQLFPNDVLLAFEGVDIASDGTVPFLNGERIAFSYLTSQKFTGDVATLDVLRDGAPMRLQIKLMRPNSLVKHHLGGRDPSFLVVAGIVFTVVTEPYLEAEYGAEYGREAPIKLLDKLLHAWKEHEDQEVVVINQVLACNATLGYEEVYNTQVHKFNGSPVRNLRQLTEMVGACTETHMRFDVDYGEVVVIDTPTAREATEEILRLHSIPNVVSKDLLDALPADSAALPTASALAALPAATAAATVEEVEEEEPVPAKPVPSLPAKS